MSDRGFIFGKDSVLAFLAGRKTQTRRVIKSEDDPDPGYVWSECLCREIDPSDTPCCVCECRFSAPYARPGDVVWVREALVLGARGRWFYEADQAPVKVAREDRDDMLAWAHHKEADRCSARHMPKFAARIRRAVLSVWPERLQDITEADARAEGYPLPYPVAHKLSIRGLDGTFTTSNAVTQFCDPRSAYYEAWEAINGKRAPWASEPWVWRYDLWEVA
jgi:hypothetical protein